MQGSHEVAGEVETIHINLGFFLACLALGHIMESCTCLLENFNTIMTSAAQEGQNHPKPMPSYGTRNPCNFG